MRNTRLFALSFTIAISVAALAAVIWLSSQPTAHSAPVEPAQGAPATGGAVSAGNTFSNGSGIFADIPNMSITTTFIRTGDLLINFSAESLTSNASTRFYIRCLVDGNVLAPNEMSFDQGTERECHAMNFLAPNVGLGTHQIRMQWRQTGGGIITIDERTLAYSNVN